MCLKPRAASVRRRRQRRKAHRLLILPPPKAFGDALCWRHRSSFSWNPDHGLVYFGARTPGGPLPYIPSGSHRCLPSCPHNGICWEGDAWSCWAVLLGSSSCCPLPAVSHYPKMDLELISPMPLRVSINLPALLVPGVPAELLLGVTGTSLGFGGVFWDSAGLGVGFSVLLCLPSPMAASHPPLIPPGWEKYFQNLGDLGVFPKFQLPPFPNCVLVHSPVFCGLGDRQVLGVPLILQEFSSGKMLGGFPSPAPPACSLPLLRV